MSAEPSPVRQAEIDAAAAAVRAAPAARREKLGALAYDVLSRQAEGRVEYAGQPLVRGRAEEHGVSHEDAATEAGNLLAVLERGAQTALERALVAAFAVDGFAAALADDDEKGARERVFRFVRHADWLEVCTEHRVYALVDALLDPPLSARVWRELAQVIVDDAAGRDGDLPRVRAKNVARATALAAASGEGAREALREVVRSTALDEPTRLLASALLGDGAEEKPAVSPRLLGAIGRAPRAGALEIVRWLTGWAALAWVARALAFLLGLRRHAEVRLGDKALEVRTQVTLLGRTVRESEETWRLDALEEAGREVRYPALHLLLGAVTLSAGVLFGGLMLFDGARSGELVLLMLASVIVLAGAGLDLALDVLVPGRRGRVVVDLRARARRPLRLTRVSVDEADTFLRALRKSAGHA